MIFFEQFIQICNFEICLGFYQRENVDLIMFEY